MKIVLCIAGQKICPDLQATLGQHDYRVTKLASEGGFLKKGNATFLIGVDDDKVEDVLSLVQEISEEKGGGTPADRALAIVMNAQAGADLLNE
ncbi:cyclic-di-AMP receptor [Numidum massiliense]|uniref:cyclic-di-AMP receptor n=1 Tax=Numidum massiliense TaxID=1522315 RepID=UPI0006D586DE|nr:cyclic-di-AMP receptor [Numidum massiliense]